MTSQPPYSGTRCARSTPLTPVSSRRSPPLVSSHEPTIRSSSARTGPVPGAGLAAVGSGEGENPPGSPSTTVGVPPRPVGPPSWAMPVVTSTVATPARASPVSVRRRPVRLARRSAAPAGSAASGRGVATRPASVCRSARSSSSSVTANGRFGPPVRLS
ncbi:hypothetical protein [Micromonospora sp. I033]